MAQRSRIWAGNTGSGAAGDAGPYSDANWRDIWKYNGLYSPHSSILLGSGVAPDPGLNVSPGAGLNVTVSAGRANVQGAYYENDSNLTLAIAANASGNPRIDSVILRVDYTAQTVRCVILQGTPAASPVAPTLTQNALVWESSIAEVDVANGVASFTTSNIWQHRNYHNSSQDLFYENVLNNSGGALRSGDIVFLDNGTYSPGFGLAATTSSTLGARHPLGVWVGYTANGARGRVQYAGLGWIRVTTPELTPRGWAIVQSSSANIGIPVTTGVNAGGVSVVGIMLEDGPITDKLCKAIICAPPPNRYGSIGITGLKQNQGNITTVSTSFVDVSFGGSPLSTQIYHFGAALQISFSCVVSHSAPGRIDFDIAINGVDLGSTDLGCAGGLLRAPTVGAGLITPVSWVGLVHLQSSGIVNPGLNTITLRWKQQGGTATMYNGPSTAAEDYPAYIAAVSLG